MSKLKTVEEMTHLEVNNEIMERRHDCGLNYNIGRWALKWLRLEQDAGFGPFDGKPVEVEESDRKGAYVSDDLYQMVCDLNSWCRYCLEFFPDLSEKNSKNIRDAINRSTDWIANQPQSEGRMKESLCKAQERLFTRKPSIDVDTGKVRWKESESEEKDALHYTLKDDEFTLYRGDEVELKIVGISSARIVRLEQPTSLDIDTPTLKRCGSRFLVYCEEDCIEYPIDLRIHDLTFFRTPGQHTTKIDVYLRRKTEDSAFEIFAAKEDARIIQNAWLELG